MAKSASSQQIDYSIRKVAALLNLQQSQQAVRDLQAACKLPGGAARAIELVELVCRVGTVWQAQHWAYLIEAGESRNPLSARDGRRLKRIAAEDRLAAADLAGALATVLEARLHADASRLLVEAWTAGRTPSRAALSLVRSYGYLQAGRYRQALRDALTAAAFGPQKEGRSCWPRALAATSAAIEGSQADNTQAALHMCLAAELQPGSREYADDLERLMRRIPLEEAEALKGGGSAALERLLAERAEEALPEFRRARPKYFYYYNWMRERVRQHCGQLPQPVLEKVIRIDATELDMLLTYPEGIQRQAAKLLEAYESGGADGLAATRLPLLTYKEAQALKAEHAAPAIEAAPGAAAAGLLPSPKATGEDAEEDFDAMEPI